MAFLSRPAQRAAGWIGVDLDGTLVRTSDWRNIEYIGMPIPVMAERVKRWLAEGRDVRIFTARVAPMFSPSASRKERLQAQRAQWAIEDWCIYHFGEALPVTAVKDFSMAVLYDDRCIPVEPDTGCLMMDETWAHEGAMQEEVAPGHDLQEQDKSFWKRFIAPIFYLLTRGLRAARLVGSSS